MKIEQLYLAHKQDIKRFVVHFIGQVDEDLEQECWLNIHKSIHSFKGRARFTSWAYVICRNTVGQYLRKKKYTHVPYEDKTPAPHRHVDEDLIDLCDIINKLSSKKRTILILHYILGYTSAEISSIYQCPKASIATNMHYTLKQLNGGLR